MEAAKRNGKKIGRPKGKLKNGEYYLQKYSPVTRNLKMGISLRKTAKICQVSINTVRKVKEALDDSHQK
ncbi:MAG: DNA invertase Pin-like site-specific DNA recombinase [Parvicellaceae bacterium]|jgi:DNA invertase Pin-like site-specific DNA recombinase